MYVPKYNQDNEEYEKNNENKKYNNFEELKIFNNNIFKKKQKE